MNNVLRTGFLFAVLAFAQSCLAQEVCPSGDIPTCIESGSYHPCDFGNSIGISQCAWGYAELEERKIKRLEKEIEQSFSIRRLPPIAQRSFRRWQAHWRAYRDASCKESSGLAEIVVQGLPGIVLNGTDFHEGFCLRRANEARRAELGRFLEVAK